MENTNNIATEPQYDDNLICVYGAREHNLHNIDVTIPRHKLSVITGLSGSGKSSLAFDTIYAEGQRRYLETFSAYARQFLGNLERPDVDKITGLSPVIAIEQKTTNKNPRSTVGTTTEIYDFLRLLYARAADAFSKITGEQMVRYSDDQILNLILEQFDGKKTLLLAPVVRSRKGHYRELFEQILKKGFLQVRVNGKLVELTYGYKVERYKTHNIEIVIDKLKVSAENRKRIKESLDVAMKHGKGIVMATNADTGETRYYSRSLMCPTSGISYDEPAPNSFSFNSPQGACPKCKGLGTLPVIDLEKVFPDKSKSIYSGGIAPLGSYKNTLIFRQIEGLGKEYGFTLKTTIKDLPDDALDVILNGSTEPILVQAGSTSGVYDSYKITFDGIAKYIEDSHSDNENVSQKRWADKFISYHTCADCAGTRLTEDSRYFRLDGKNIAELADADISELAQWLENLEDRLSAKQRAIAHEILKEIRARIGFLLDVGLGYLSLNRASRSLSGGESQRIRLATQIGSKLINVLYILDEPSIGLHQRDNQRLINSLKQLRDSGNSVLVVEHDKDMILAADYVIDMGPMAGRHGGKVIAQGTPEELMKFDTLTTQYLRNSKSIAVPEKRRKGSDKVITVKNARGHNLKNLSIDFPLGTFICVTGVSGSGKSSLINETLHAAIAQKLYGSVKEPLPYDEIVGLELIDKVIEVDQAPIGRTPRSNPATYTAVFNDIRKLYERLPEAMIRGYKAGRFSFNVAGGRCETCKGGGMKVIEMNFLPDVYVHCEDCNGKRYNRETLEVRYKGKSISDVLNMTIEDSVEFFNQIPSIAVKLKALNEVGLGYITLGQSSTTLSGGEAQRVKLATELAKRDTGKTLYILDEPTTGLHFEDIRVLLEVLNRLVDKGNTVLVIEHNMDVIKVADHIIDIGPEGGKAGGLLIAQGTPEQIAKNKNSLTGKFLKEELKP